jgi:hypothetical protein
VAPGKVVEIIPVDNIIVAQNVRSVVLQQWIDIRAVKCEWPCAGIPCQVKNKKTITIIIRGTVINSSMVYTFHNRSVLTVREVIAIC